MIEVIDRQPSTSSLQYQRAVKKVEVNELQYPRQDYLDSRPPRTDSLATPDTLREYKRALDPSLYRANYGELRGQAGTFFHTLLSMMGHDPCSRYPLFKNLAAGFSIEATPADSIKGDTHLINLLDDRALREQAMREMARGIHYSHILTHPTVLQSRLNLLASPLAKNGRIPLSIPFIEDAIKDRKALTWEDLGWALNERKWILHENEVEDVRTSDIRAEGMWVPISSVEGRVVVAKPILGNSHHAMMNSWSLAELALLGSFGFVSCDGVYGSKEKLPNGRSKGLEAQYICAKTALDIIDQHPMLFSHPNRSHILSNGETVVKHLVKEARKRVGVTFKPGNPEEAAERASFLANELGITTFRIFDPRDTKGLADTVAAVANRLAKEGFSDAVIFAGQVVGVEEAVRCNNAGADAYIINIGDGGHCSTASGTKMIPNNVINWYEIQREPSLKHVGIIVDGGVGEIWTELIGGITGSMKHQSLIGGTLQQTPGILVIRDIRTGRLGKLLSGEAGKRTKFEGRNFDPTGMPLHVEGIDGHTWLYWNDFGTTMSEIMFRRFETAAAKGMSFLNAQKLIDFFQWENRPLVLPTSAAIKMSAPTFRPIGE